MAETMTYANEPRTITLNATALKVTEVNFAPGARSVLIQFFAADGVTTGSGRFSYTDTDGDAITTARSKLLATGASITIPLQDENSLEAITTIYLASTVNSGIVDIVSSEGA